MDNKSIKEKINIAKEDVKKVASNTTKTIKNTASKVSDISKKEYSRVKENVKKTVSNSELIKSVGNKFNTFSYYTKDFAEKNSTISKFVFIIFLFIMFGLLFRLGIYILSLFIMPEKNPIIIDGMLNTNKLKKFNVNPNDSDPNPILRSINEHQGLEFTWSFWINIADIQYSSDATNNENIKRIFSKGESINKENWDSMNSPGVYIYKGDDDSTRGINTLCIVFETHSNEKTPVKHIYIDNIPLQKWINVIIKVQSRTIDIYINSVLTERYELTNVVKQNYGDIYVGGNGAEYNYNGMNGYISNLRYFNYSIGNNKIQDIVNLGPNTKLIDDNMTETKPPYFSLNWYL